MEDQAILPVVRSIADIFHERGALICFGETLGVNSLRLSMIQNVGADLTSDYSRMNVADENDPLHMAFLETRRDPRLGLSTANLYDTANWRQRSLAMTLPSDALPADCGRDDLKPALRQLRGGPTEIIALCAAGRIHCPTDLDLRLQEARAPQALGFVEQARYLMKDRLALGGKDIRLH